MSGNIVLRQSIVISSAPEKIFDYVSDVSNDPLWRPEVEKMEVKGPQGVGMIIIEYIRIYRFFSIVTPTAVRELDRPDRFVIETPPTHPHWVECIRTINDLGNGRSQFNVQLSFSLSNLRQVSPILPPRFAVIWWYRPRMRRYMKKLKFLLEHA